MTAPPSEDYLIVHQGADWSARWLVADPDTSVGLDLSSDYSARGQVRAWHGRDTVLHTWDSAGATPNLILGADGYITLSVSAAESTAWTWRSGVYDLELSRTSSGLVTRVAQGVILVLLEITTA